jgi:predicted nucleotidyltransferase
VTINRALAVVLLFGTFAVERCRAEHQCETSAVDVTIENLRPDPNKPSLYLFELKVTDSCPDDDDYEGVQTMISWCDDGSNRPCYDDLGQRQTDTVVPIHPRKDHEMLSRTQYANAKGRLKRIWVSRVRVFGSYILWYDINGTVHKTQE